MKISILAVSLVVFGIGAFVLLNSTLSGPAGAQEVNGWCCVNGQLFPATDRECKEKNGRFSLSKSEASQFCRPAPPAPKCCCCVKGEVVETTPAKCKEKGGQCFATKEEALKNCRP